MALDTFSSVWGKVLLRCPAASSLLARDWVSQAFRRVAERRPWSWLIKEGQFILYPLYGTGTVTTVQNSKTVTGLGTMNVAVGANSMISQEGSYNVIIGGNALFNPANPFPHGNVTSSGTGALSVNASDVLSGAI